MKTIYEQKANLGNNESATAKGLYQEANGLYLALTFTKSKTFKTEKAARKFLGL
jgi:hypothetical protein